eukprot:scaffold6156_cov384-Prasinococcus_capsulatus_cf.AAC.2
MFQPLVVPRVLRAFVQAGLPRCPRQSLRASSCSRRSRRHIELKEALAELATSAHLLAVLLLGRLCRRRGQGGPLVHPLPNELWRQTPAGPALRCGFSPGRSTRG